MEEGSKAYCQASCWAPKGKFCEHKAPEMTLWYWRMKGCPPSERGYCFSTPRMRGSLKTWVVECH